MLNTFGYEYLRKRNRVLSIRTKLLIGMALASLTMCLAGFFEIVRQKYCPTGQTSVPYHNFSLIDWFHFSRPWSFRLESICAITTIYLHGSFGSFRHHHHSWIRLSCRSTFRSIALHEFTILFRRHLIFHQQRLSRDLSDGIGPFWFQCTYTRMLAFPFCFISFRNFQCSNDEQWTFTTYFFILAFLQLAFMFITYLCDRRFNLFEINQQQQQLASPSFQENSSNASTA